MAGKFLKVAIEAAKKSEKMIMRHWRGRITYSLKEDMSPVTVADKEAEEAIIKIIKKNFPDHGILGEETGKKAGGEYTWYIDPIDGTKNYMRNIPIFGTQIALIKNGEVIAGVSNAPALKEMMYAEKGHGTFLNGKKVRVSKTDKIEKSYLIYGELVHFEKNKLLGNLISLSKNAMCCRGIGDFWSYHLVAQGKADAMFEAHTKIWDIAALKLIVEEAGGRMTDINGKQIDENVRSAIATNSRIHDKVISYFK